MELKKVYNPNELPDGLAVYFDQGTHCLVVSTGNKIRAIYNEPGNISVGECWTLTE